jgi:hypothetical protein
VFDDFSVEIETEDVDAGVDLIAGPRLSAMQHDEVTFGNRANELDLLGGVLIGHPFEVLDERLLAVADMGLCWR